MGDSLNRCFEKNQPIYVVDYYGIGMKTEAIGTRAYIVCYDKDRQIFKAILYGDTYNTYSVKDAGRLFFNSLGEAVRAANKLPKPHTIMYQKKDNNIYKKEIVGIRGHYVDGVYDLVVCFNRGESVSIKEIGHTLFFKEADAR